jgi:hypothetical protein
MEQGADGTPSEVIRFARNNLIGFTRGADDAYCPHNRSRNPYRIISRIDATIASCL